MSREGTNDLAARVARHFSDPEWFTTFEFPLWSVGTEDGKDRQLDALAVSRVAGRGNEVHGIEIKSDRGDWQRELETPAKAEPWLQRLDRFWLVAGKDVVKLEEVPSTWGFLEESGSGLKTVLKAPPLQIPRRMREEGGEPIPRELWVRILRRTVSGLGRDAQVDAAYTRGHEAGVKEAKEEGRRDDRDREGRFRELVETVKAFEKSSGVSLASFAKYPDGREYVRPHGRWQGEKLGAAVKVVLEHEDVVSTMASHLHSFERNTRDLRQALEAAGWKLGDP